MSIKKFLNNFFSGAYPLGLFLSAATALVFTPIFLLYNDDKNQITFTLVSFGLILAICLVALLLPLLLRKFIPGFIRIFDSLATGLALYLLGATIFYPVQSGIMDGGQAAISISDKSAHWVLLAGCALLPLLLEAFKPSLAALCRRLAIILGTFALAAGLYMGASVIPLQQKDLSAQWKQSSSLSPKHNIIIIGMDGIQGAFANEILAHNPQLASLFDGFTFFDNAASSFCNTGFSFRGIFDGRLPNNGVKELNPQDNLFNDMLRHGYRVSVSDYLMYLFPQGLAEKKDALVAIPKTTLKSDPYLDSITLALLGAARYLPITIQYKNPRTHKEFGTLSKLGERETFQALIDNLHVDGNIEQQLLWFFSLSTHAPVRFTKTGEFSFNLTEDDIYGEIEDGLNMTGKLLAKLKELGIYDQSLIIIMSDHGSHLTLRMKNLPEKQQYMVALLGKYGPMAGLFQPLLMIKPFSVHGDLQYSDSSVTFLALRKFLNELGAAKDEAMRSGRDIFKRVAGEKDCWVDVLQLRVPNGKDVSLGEIRDWEPGRLHLPIAEHYRADNLTVQLKSLEDIKIALDAYHKDRGAYPVSEGFDGLYSIWGYKGEDWIKGLAPQYLPALPHDTRNNDNPTTQFIYRSDGKNYKLISHGGVRFAEVARDHPEMIDPRRKTHAYGYWTAGAVTW